MKLGVIESAVLKCVNENPNITEDEISQKLKVDVVLVLDALYKLKKKGLIKGGDEK